MNSKTPVTILQELMTRRHCIAQYDLLATEGVGTHLPTFRYRVIVDDEVCAFGSAGSKREAKHDAAKHMLEKLQELGIYEPDTATDSSPPKLVSSLIEQSPIIPILNAIGKLQDFCFENNVPKPEFTLLADIGPPHLRQFTYECKVSTIVATATDLTKKKAKQVVAQKMLERLLETLPEQIDSQLAITETSVEDTSLEVQRTFYKEVAPNYPKRKLDFRQTISSYPQTIKLLIEEKNLTVEDLWKEDMEPENLLKSILEKLELTCFLEYYTFSSQITAFISIQASPEFLIAKHGKNKEEAFQEAVKEALEFLEILAK